MRMNLPEDVVFQILLKLPVRTLLRFRSVCKDWYALIKSSLFKDTHLALRQARAGSDEFIVFKHTVLTCRRYGDYVYSVTCCISDYESLVLSVSAATSNDFKIPGTFRGWMKFINHVNGIFCIASENLLHITLLNPALREVKNLPIPYLGLGFVEYHIESLGFGYDSATNDYKLIGIVRPVEGGLLKACISVIYRLSTSSSSWTILGEMPTCFLGSVYCGSSIFLHGSIHWVMVGNGDCRILTFNMTNELFQEINFPCGWKDYQYEMSPQLITIERSTIALVAFTNPSSSGTYLRNQPFLDVWVMKEYGVTESWIKQYSIRNVPQIDRTFCFWGKDKLFFSLLDAGKLICYDFSKGQIYQQINLRREDVVTSIDESLVSIK